MFNKIYNQCHCEDKCRCIRAGGYCNCICLTPTEITLREQQAYTRGHYDGINSVIEKRFLARTISEQEILDKVKKAIESLKEITK